MSAAAFLAASGGGAQREVLAVGQLWAGAVSLVGGGEDDPSDPMSATGLEDVPGAAYVYLEGLQGRFAGDTDDRLRGQVEDRIATANRGVDPIGVAQVGLGQIDLIASGERVGRGASGPPAVALARASQLEDPHGVAALGQRPRQMGADEAVGTGD